MVEANAAMDVNEQMFAEIFPSAVTCYRLRDYLTFQGVIGCFGTIPVYSY